MGQIPGLILKNTWRNPLRTVLTILGIAVGVIAYGFLQTVLAAYYIGAEASSPNRLVTRHRVSLFNLLPLAHREKILAVPGVTKVAYGVWFGGYYKDPQNFFAQFSINPEYLNLYPEFLLPEDQRQAYESELQAAVIGRKLAERFDWKVGDRITLVGTIFPGDWEFIIRGVYEGRHRNTDETAMFFHWKRIDERIQNRSLVGWYLIGVEDPSQNARISDAIDNQFINSAAPTLTETEKEFNLSFVSMMGTIITVIKVAAWIVIGIVLLIMANTMTMAARERIAEYGVLKTLGFRAPHMLALIGGEALYVAFMGATVGCAIAFGLVGLIGKWIEMNVGAMFPVFEMTPLTAAQAIGLAMAAGLVAALAPLNRAIRLPISDALRRVE